MSINDTMHIGVKRTDSFEEEMNIFRESMASNSFRTPLTSARDDNIDYSGPIEANRTSFGAGDFYFNMTGKQIIDANYVNNAMFSQCEDLKPLGHGSHSKVMMCKYKKRKVVVKTVSDKYCHDPVAQQEFQREVTILSRLNHSHILKLYASGMEQQRSLIIVELLEGGTLKSHLSIRRSFFTRPFTEIRYLRMAREFVDALDYLHNRFDSKCTLIHRDLKPDNIGFTADGTLKLLDFGLCIALEKGKADNGVYQLTGMCPSLP